MAEQIVVNRKRGKVPLARPLGEELARAGLYLSKPVVQQALRLVGEYPERRSRCIYKD